MHCFSTGTIANLAKVGRADHLIFMTSSLWLIGAGTMGQAMLLTMLQAQGVPFRVIGRSASSAATFQHSTGLHVHEGGLEVALLSMPAPSHAIVAVGVEQLASTAHQLLAAGCQQLMLEKPGLLTLSDLQSVHADAQVKGARFGLPQSTFLCLRAEAATAGGGGWWHYKCGV